MDGRRLPAGEEAPHGELEFHVLEGEEIRERGHFTDCFVRSTSLSLSSLLGQLEFPEKKMKKEETFMAVMLIR